MEEGEMQMRKYRIYVGAGVLIFALVLSYLHITESVVPIIFKIPEAQKKQYPFPF